MSVCVRAAGCESNTPLDAAVEAPAAAPSAQSPGLTVYGPVGDYASVELGVEGGMVFDAARPEAAARYTLEVGEGVAALIVHAAGEGAQITVRGPLAASGAGVHLDGPPAGTYEVEVEAAGALERVGFIAPDAGFLAWSAEAEWAPPEGAVAPPALNRYQSFVMEHWLFDAGWDCASANDAAEILWDLECPELLATASAPVCYQLHRDHCEEPSADTGLLAVAFVVAGDISFDASGTAEEWWGGYGVQCYGVDGYYVDFDDHVCTWEATNSSIATSDCSDCDYSFTADFDTTKVTDGRDCTLLDEALGYYGYTVDTFVVGEMSFGYESVSTGTWYHYDYTLGYHWVDYYGYGWYPSYYYSGYDIDLDLDGFREYYQGTNGWYGIYY